MTRRSTLPLVTLVAGLLSLASVATVSADTPCTGYAQEHCEEMMAAKDAALLQAALVAPVHLLSANGFAQEHFEAMSVAQPDLFIIAPSGPTAMYLPTFAREHYEERAATVELNKGGNAVRIVQFGQEHYEEIMAATAASN